MDNKIDPNKTHNMRTPRYAKTYSEERKAFYLFGFTTTIKQATQIDVDNKTLYGMQLVSNFHSLVLPIRLLEREIKGTIISKDYSYYVYLGKMIIGILYISVKTFTKTRVQIEYNYKYKVDGRNYRNATGTMANYTSQYSSNISKKKANSISARNKNKNKKDKLE